jgi:hypothetical protein
VVTADLRARNGVVHIIDNMLGNGESRHADVTKLDASAVQAASKLIDAEFLDESKVSSFVHVMPQCLVCQEINMT